jgi:hypothetical protein
VRHEPALRRKDWHFDWAWRIARPSGWGKREFVNLSTTADLNTEQVFVGRVPVTSVQSYVVFRRPEIVAENPPLVATYTKTDRGTETWEEDAASMRVRELVFGLSARGLRTGNPQQPHRHYRRHLRAGKDLSGELAEALGGNCWRR